VHSRHSKVTDDGSDVRHESDCIDRVLLQALGRQPPHEGECLLLVMSDRSRTLDLLRDRASQFWNCSVVSAQKTVDQSSVDESNLSSSSSSSSSWRTEHGPYSGIGYYQDWALLASHGRRMHGFVGGKRSSSLLVREVVEYDRWNQYHQIEASRATNGSVEASDPVRPPLLTTCLLFE
jgi:hypothetical protein